MDNKQQKDDLTLVNESYYQPEYATDLNVVEFKPEDIPWLTSPQIVWSVSVQ